MRKLALNDVVRRIVGLAIASTVGAGSYACGAQENAAVAPVDGGAVDASLDVAADVDAANAPFADEDTFACDAPLPSILEQLTPVAAVDYVELRDQGWTLSPSMAPQGATSKSVANGMACAAATSHSACVDALAALAPTSASDGWLADDPIGPGTTAEVRQILVYSRGDEVGAVRTPAAVAAFLGTIDSLEEARLVLQAQGQRFVCTTMPRKSGYRRNADGSWEILLVSTTCGGLIPYRHRYVVAKDATTTLVATDESLNNGDVCGRRPAGLSVPGVPPSSMSGVAAHFARAAHLEAASVIAFRRLELELRRFGAPASFASRAQRARADEINHARDTARIARRFGATVPAVDVTPMTPRSLFAFALENAVEGAVRETYGALVAAFQAERASPEIRPLLRRIARDEARHAELAHDIDRWVQPKLSADERTLLAAARAEALADLHAAIACEPDESVARIAGAPTAAEARILFDGLDREILAAA